MQSGSIDHFDKKDSLETLQDAGPDAVTSILNSVVNAVLPEDDVRKGGDPLSALLYSSSFRKPTLEALSSLNSKSWRLQDQIKLLERLTAPQDADEITEEDTVPASQLPQSSFELKDACATGYESLLRDTMLKKAQVDAFAAASKSMADAQSALDKAKEDCLSCETTRKPEETTSSLLGNLSVMALGTLPWVMSWYTANPYTRFFHKAGTAMWLDGVLGGIVTSCFAPQKIRDVFGSTHTCNAAEEEESWANQQKERRHKVEEAEDAVQKACVVLSETTDRLMKALSVRPYDYGSM